MSVYIKWFPLPNNCGACPLRLAWCRERIYMVTRPERCPLVPVPPHGRLIDADALIDKVIAKYLKFEREGKLVFAAAEIKQDIVDLISDAPTIIPADPAEEGET